jgi:hypothetical protein
MASSTRASSRRASARDLHCSRSDFFMVVRLFGRTESRVASKVPTGDLMIASATPTASQHHPIVSPSLADGLFVSSVVASVVAGSRTTLRNLHLVTEAFVFVPL